MHDQLNELLEHFVNLNEGLYFGKRPANSPSELQH
ncbi:hypothetical protein YSA_04712 [Pseudomonas putida ND6]|uniref:Uncharacterized protein n=1 Tax=Pseudomonas putida ND6 TaxID=231023 RepID=I3UV02_PSEPU|nr:hypothetical protein YSA_04712 [Pseudomonas putida ND6]